MQNENTNNSSDSKSENYPAGALKPGSHVGKYEIKQIIGSGAQSIVYLGYDRLLDRPVAIKQISTNLLADPRFLKRFRSEAKILAQLGSEGTSIVSVFDLLENENGMFIAMEYINGRTMRDILAHQKYALPLKIAGGILGAVARGLSLAHKAGIVHRDIKPGNIMVTRGFDAKIMDFGVAARAGEDDSMSLGTTKYMAPEVFKGANVDVRADIYSLGMMAYEMLTGREFFDKLFVDIIGDRKTENLRWMKWHCDSSNAAPALNEVNLLITPHLGAIISKMMAKDPAARYDSVDTVLDELHQAIEENIQQQNQSPAPEDQTKVISADLDDSNMGLLVEAAAEYDDAPTGKLPVSPTQAKRRVTVAVIAITLLLLAGVGVAVKFGLDHKKLVSSALSQWENCGKKISDANNAYKSGDVEKSSEMYNEALESLKKYRSDFADMRQPLNVTDAWIFFCQANIAMINDDAAAADTLIVNAEKLGVLQQQSISAFKERLTIRSDAEMYLNKLSAAVELEDFSEARIMRAHYDDIKQPPLDIDRKAALIFSDMDNAIRLREFRRAVDAGDAALAQADAITAQDDLDLFDQAQMHLDQAKGHYRKAMSVAAGESVDAKLEALDRAADFMAARKAYLTAGGGITLDQKIDLLQKIIDTRIPDERTLKLFKNAKSDRFQQLADELIFSNSLEDMLTAQKYLSRAYEQSAREEIKTKLDKLNLRIKREELLAQAQQYKHDQDYKKQLETLRQLARRNSDIDLSYQIEQAQIDMYLKDAEQARVANQWEQARQLYEKARNVRINDSQLALRIDKLSQYLQKQQLFYELIDQAAELSENSDYAKAIRKLIRAIELGQELSLDTTDVAKRLNQARYSNEVTKGKKYLRQGHPNLALPLFKTARKYDDTEEVRQLIKQAELEKHQMEMQQEEDQQ